VTRIRAAFLALCACNRCSLLARTALEACGPRDSGQSRARGAVGAVRAQSIRPALRGLRPIGRSPRRAAYGGGGTEVYRGGGDRAGRAVDDYGPRCRRRRRARRQPGSLTRSQPDRRRHHRHHHSNPSFCCSECLASAVGCTASRPHGCPAARQHGRTAAGPHGSTDARQHGRTAALPPGCPAGRERAIQQVNSCCKAQDILFHSSHALLHEQNRDILIVVFRRDRQKDQLQHYPHKGRALARLGAHFSQVHSIGFSPCLTPLDRIQAGSGLRNLDDTTRRLAIQILA